MNKAEIKQIAEYIKDLEEGLYEWDYTDETAEYHLTQVRQVIKRLMDATFESEDQIEKQLLATLNLKAHKCKECIERRNAVRN